MSPRAVLAVVGLAGALVFANAVPLGFALDDDPIIRVNPVVTEGDLRVALSEPYWRHEGGGGGLWRPLTVASFAVEWGLWGGDPSAFHAVNVLAHAGVSMLVAALLLQVVGPVAALLGGLVFAVHPVHVEAVANVVGRSELYAASAFLGACLLFLWRPGGEVGRGVRLVGVAALYAVGLGSKEIAVTLPGALALLAVHPATRGVPAGGASGDRSGVPSDGAPGHESGPGKGRSSGALLEDLPVFALLAAVLALYFVLRLAVLGSIIGETPADELVGTTALQRVWTALSLWPQYGRLMVFPADLVADYGAGVLQAARSFGPDVVAGVLVVGGLVGIAAVTWWRAPAVSLGILWFMVTVLPVAHVGVHAGVLLAERTLYLPSVGLALVVGGGVTRWRARAPRPWVLPAVSAAVLLLLSARTVTRTPVWESTFVLVRDLSQHHPESLWALRLYADVLRNSGDLEASARAFGEAVRLRPHRHAVLVEAGAAYGRAGDVERARELFRRAIEASPGTRVTYRLLAESYLKTGDGRAAHRTALAGLARAGMDRELWALVSEAYVLRGDFAAAERARRAALGIDPESRSDWTRLADILEAAGDTAGAARARSRALSLPEAPPSAGPTQPRSR